MKKIVPFNNVLEFNTDVREITAISLEHEIKKYPDMISGVFYISGEYKITDGQLEKEKFNFELPFDIALSNNYDLDTLIVDIDDFRYDIVSDKKLKVNIDLYIDGEEIEPPAERNIYTEDLSTKEKNIKELTEEVLSTIPKEETREDMNNSSKNKDALLQEEMSSDAVIMENTTEDESTVETTEDVNDANFDLLEKPERVDLLKDMLTTNKEDKMTEDLNININNENENETENINNNIFNPSQEEEQYVTYRVYKMLDTDTLETILTKYNITKEQLADYNDIENITPGDKLIIPTNEK